MYAAFLFLALCSAPHMDGGRGVSPAPDTTAEAPARAARLLAAHGYANVAGVADGRRLVVTYENARYRDERRALREAARLLLPALAEGEELVLVPTRRGVALLAARYASPASPPAVSFDVSDLPPALGEAPRASASFGRLDVVVHPWFEASFGDFDNPVASRTGVAPELRTALWTGFSVSAQALFTLQDDLPTGESAVRPGLVTVNQTVRLPRNTFVSATAGTFNPGRYGVDVEARRYTADGRWSAGAELALTGAADYARDGWRRTPLEEPTALVDVTWRGARYDLLVRTTAGAFLGDQRGVRVDVVRRFGEVEIGGFGVAAGGGANGGLSLRIPLLPARRGAGGPVRVRAADAFPWEYRYRVFVPAGRPFRTGNTLDDFTRRLDPRRVSLPGPDGP